MGENRERKKLKKEWLREKKGIQKSGNMIKYRYEKNKKRGVPV
jgi:hypothetical protein